ncbi:MAG: 2-amino-4-hydroxy-6-hydroxymethyldihydropteridine diphosphokinase [Phycisphaerales bacterium]
MSEPRDAAPAFVAIALGSNLGDRRAHLDGAVAALRSLTATWVVAVSPYLETAPVGPVAQGNFLNAAATLTTTLSPQRLLTHLHSIERLRGRDRAGTPRWGPRTLDLDLLLFGDRVIDEPGLTVPHPRMHERLFVLEPLSLVARHAIVPTLGCTVADLLTAARRAASVG